MVTNRKKFDDAWHEIDAKDADCIAKMLPNGLPTHIYWIGKFSAKELTVKFARRHYRGIYRKGPEEKATNKDVEAILQHLSGWAPPSEDDISIHYEYRETYGLVSGADPLSKINAGETMAWTVEQLQPEIDRRRELYEPREGCAPCQYCGKQNPPTNMIEGTVIYRMNRGLHRKTGMYCKDKPCATHDQMGHEG